MAMSGPDLVQGFIARGYSPVQAAALAGHAIQESGGDPTNVNQKEGAHGILQWRLDRWDGLQNFAKAQGKSPLDPDVQMDFVGHEMRGPEAKAGAGFLAANDLPSASAALKPFIRFGDASAPTRLANAQALMSARAGMLPPTAQAASAGAPQTAPTATPGASVAPAPDDDSGLMQSLANVSKLIQQPTTAPPAPDLTAMANLGRARQLASIMRNRQMTDPNNG